MFTRYMQARESHAQYLMLQTTPKELNAINQLLFMRMSLLHGTNTKLTAESLRLSLLVVMHENEIKELKGSLRLIRATHVPKTSESRVTFLIYLLNVRLNATFSDCPQPATQSENQVRSSAGFQTGGSGLPSVHLSRHLANSGRGRD